ncbi:MAG: hypothetical protein ACE10G_10530, partial [Gemmatimonadales bacterium]
RSQVCPILASKTWNLTPGTPEPLAVDSVAIWLRHKGPKAKPQDLTRGLLFPRLTAYGSRRTAHVFIRIR